jgi:Protein of unknown function (DUF3306)
MSDRDTDAPDGAADPPSFLQRWSKLKSAARDAERRAELAPADASATTDVDLAAQRPPLTGPAETVLPDLDQLHQDSDYSAFLSPAVDPLLRRAALRKLFHSAKFNVLDGLDDYSDDFTNFAPLGDIVTADMRHHLERAARRLLAETEAAEAPAPTPMDAPVALAAQPQADPAEPPPEEDTDDVEQRTA